MFTSRIRTTSIIALILISLPLVSVLRTSATPPATDSFQRTWARTDKPVADLSVNRTWMWGPEAFTGPLTEAYAEAPGGQRLVQYFDKSRMEDNSFRGSEPWDVTNGLLVVELMTGNMQVGDSTFQAQAPAQVNVGGDSDDPTGPTYATMNLVTNAPAAPDDAVINQRLARDGTVTSDHSLDGYGVTAAHHVSVTNLDHQIASVFWTFMNSDGVVFEHDTNTTSALFLNPFYATGYPKTEPYWANIKVGGVYKDVLLQCFERRCLTYNPGNTTGWQVEAGNVGQHYYAWRYGQPAPPTPTPTATSTPTVAANTVWVQSAFSGTSIQTTSADWQAIPDMELTVRPAASGPLAVTFSAVAYAPSRIFVRALIDGLRADPTEVVFNKGWIGSHSFTFVMTYASASTHHIQLQWHVEPGQSGTIGYMTMRVTARHSDTAFADLAVTATEGNTLTNTQTNWIAVSDLKTTITTASPSLVTATVSAHAWTSSNMGRMWVRALFDGIPFGPSEVTFVQGGPYGAVSFAFLGLTTVAGVHTVQIEWHGDAMYTAYLGNRSLVVHTSVAGTNPEWGIAGVTYENSVAPENSASYVPVPGMSTTIDTPNGGSIAATFSAVASATNNSRMWVSALIDGQPCDPAFVVFDNGGPNSVHSFTFISSNVSPGSHSVQIQWHADSGEWLTIYARTLIVMGGVPAT